MTVLEKIHKKHGVQSHETVMMSNLDTFSGLTLKYPFIESGSNHAEPMKIICSTNAIKSAKSNSNKTIRT